MDINKEEDSLDEDISKFFVTPEDGVFEDTYWVDQCQEGDAVGVDYCNIKYTELAPPATCVYNGEEKYLSFENVVGSESTPNIIIGKPLCDDAGFEIVHRPNPEDSFSPRLELDIDFDLSHIGFLELYTFKFLLKDGVANIEGDFHVMDKENYYVIEQSDGTVISTTPHGLDLVNTAYKLFENADNSYLYLHRTNGQPENWDSRIYKWNGGSFDEQIQLEYSLQTIIGQSSYWDHQPLAIDSNSQIVKIDLDDNVVLETDYYVPEQVFLSHHEIKQAAGYSDPFGEAMFYVTAGQYSDLFGIVKYDVDEDKAYWSGKGLHIMKNMSASSHTIGVNFEFSDGILTGPSVYGEDSLEDGGPDFLRMGIQELEVQNWIEFEKTPIDEENHNNNSNNESNGNSEEIPEEIDLQEWYDNGHITISWNINYLDNSMENGGFDNNELMRRILDVSITGNNYVEGKISGFITEQNYSLPDNSEMKVRFKDEYDRIYYSPPVVQNWDSGLHEIYDVPYSLGIDPMWKTAAMNFVMGGGDVTGAYTSFLEERPDIYLDGIVIGNQEIIFPDNTNMVPNDRELTTSYDQLTAPVMGQYTAIYIASPVEAKFYDYNNEIIQPLTSHRDSGVPQVVYMEYPEGGPTSKFALVYGSVHHMNLFPDETGGGEYNLKIIRKNPDGTEDKLLDVTKELIEGQYYSSGTHEFVFGDISQDYWDDYYGPNKITIIHYDRIIGSAIAATLLLGSGYALYRSRKNKFSLSEKISIDPPAQIHNPIPSVEQQWVDNQGRTWRRLNNGCTQMWNGTDWQDI